MPLRPVQRVEADVAIVGSGFGGSIMALALRQQGRSVVLLERDRHPRFAIGESSTPLANLLLEELADRWHLPRLRPLCKWGSWQKAYPDLGCGLKRGFSFFRHETDRPFSDDSRHARQLLVAASPHDAVADTHWYRPDVDQFLASEAKAAGALLLEKTTLERVSWQSPGAVIEGQRAGRALRIEAAFVIDASGPRGFLQRALTLPETPLRWLPPTQALYTHFEGVERWDALVASDEEPPYPVDDAALHHVFDGGWIWVLRFGNGLTSAGAAVTDDVAARVGLAEGAPAWRRLLRELPAVRDQFAAARTARPFVHTPRVGFRSGAVWGPRWALLPSAAGVIDPLLSTGFPLNLLGITRLLDVLERSWPSREFEEGLAGYGRETDRELEATERLVAALYATMGDFELFKRLSVLYFAAASFSEAARRLGRAERAPGLLLCGHETFGPESAACAESALTRPRGEERARLLERIDQTVAPFDVAGLRDRSRRDWYPVLGADLLAAAPLLGASEEELKALLIKSGFGVEPQRPGQGSR